ncbi:MAG: cyclase family protein [Oscillospiraceae bacterium]|nr:cyclase family protein [Oscillospiraceae bacterium]
MIIYDISQEVFSCRVYPGDPAPEKKTLSSMVNGDPYNLTALTMCAHNGTHIDAPFHFIRDGKTVDAVCMETFVGMACVVEHHGIVSGDDAAAAIEKAKEQDPEAAKRILIKGDAEVSSEASKVFAGSGILLLGNESQTVGPEDAPMAVHQILLAADVVLLEGIRLAEVSEGVYLLNAAPLNLAGADGSPCRALLIAAEERRIPVSGNILSSTLHGFIEPRMTGPNRLL